MENSFFLRAMPKIELHAHLNGSLNIDAIKELGEALYGVNTEEFVKLTHQFIDFDNTSLDGCFQKFKFMHELTASRKGLELATWQVIRDFASDNVIYLELRTTPKTNEHMTKLQYLETVLAGIQRAEKDFSTRVKILPSIDRSRPVEEAIETMSIVLELSQLYASYIAGIDFSGNPNTGNFKDFLPTLEKARSNGLKLALHCAETDNAEEVAEMLAFGMERCGHGTFLSAKQIQELGQRNVAIECCLTSNVKCGTVPSFDDHHFKRIFEAQHAVVLCTDDGGVFDTSLTREFVLAQQTFSLHLDDLYQLSINAIDHAFADSTEKEKMHVTISKYFEDNKRLE